jgi:hypothetical protein
MNRRQKIMRKFAGLLASSLLTLVLLEAAAWFIDPLGISQYVYELSQIVTIPNEEGYTLEEGRVQFRHWGYTIDSQGDRVLPPPAADAACVIAFVGDSNTFGQGVDDTETFAYELAVRYPDVRFINTGKIAYNIENVRRAIDGHQADGYFYFISNNDDGLPWLRPESDYGVPRTPLPRLSALRYYYEAFKDRDVLGVTDRDAFWEVLNGLRARSDLAMVAMGGVPTSGERDPLGEAVTARYPDILFVPRWERALQNSWIDHHPNPDGHDWLVAQLAPVMDALVARQCTAA